MLRSSKAKAIFELTLWFSIHRLLLEEFTGGVVAKYFTFVQEWRTYCSKISKQMSNILTTTPLGSCCLFVSVSIQ